MKPSTLIVIGSVTAVAIMGACKQDSGSNQQGGRARFGYGGTNSTTATDAPFVEPTPAPQDPATTPAPASQTPPPPVAPTPPTREISYGTPVPGKPGFVTSPHMPYAGYVDVRGFPPGTEVKCPYSGKIFLVP